MFRIFCAVIIVSLCVCDLRVSASRLVYPQLRALQEKELSSTEHYKNEQHDRQFDHEAFLGQETAQEWEQLPSDEVKEKLRELFPKIDIDRDSKVSVTELYEWIEQHMRKHVLRGADLKMRDIDTDKNGKVSWEEYKASEFPPFTEEGLNDKTLAELREIESRDKKRFEFSDTDNDNLLSREELTLFLHPEESKRMTSYLVEENMDVFDGNKDGKVSLEEYLGEGVDQLDKETKDSLSNSFKRELDLNHDGHLDKNEIRRWILPGVDEDPIQSETNHLMKLGDDNKDEFLSVDELVKHYRDFAGSRVTRYGDLLKEEL